MLCFRYLIYVNQIENRITLKVKTRQDLELLTPETMKLLGNTKSKKTKDENGENVPHLEITEAIVVHSNFFNKDYHQDLRILYTFVSNKSSGQLYDISPKKFCLLYF